MGHGSKKFKNTYIKYDPKEFKIIRLVWQELCNEEFKPDPKKDLSILVQEEVGKLQYQETQNVLKSLNHFATKNNKVYFTQRSGYPIEISKELKPIIILALRKKDGQYHIKEGHLYI